MDETGSPRAGDVILTTEAPLGEVAQLEHGRIALAQRIILLRGKSGELDNTFLRFLLQSEDIRNQLISRASGTTVTGIKQSELRKVQLVLPPIGEQERIATVLDSLSSAINVKAQASDTMERIARAIFKSWFVDFDPVRAKAERREPTGMDAATARFFPEGFEGSDIGSIPIGWSVSTIGDIAHVIDCLHSKKPLRVSEGRPFLQLANIRDDGLLDLTDRYNISEVDYRQWTSRIEASPGDCVITNVGRVGAVAQVPADCNAALGRNMTAIRCKAEFHYPTFLIELLTSGAMKNEIGRRTDSGTILESLNVRSIPLLRFTRPCDAIGSIFEDVCRPIRARMESALLEAQTLTNVRDTLLPRLISGKLRVPVAEKLVEAVL